MLEKAPIMCQALKEVDAIFAVFALLVRRASGGRWTVTVCAVLKPEAQLNIGSPAAAVL